MFVVHIMVMNRCGLIAGEAGAPARLQKEGVSEGSSPGLLCPINLVSPYLSAVLSVWLKLQNELRLAAVGGRGLPGMAAGAGS